MDNIQLAKEILKLLGREENIDSVTHCVTRLRVTVIEKEKVNVDKLKNTKGIIGVNTVGNQIQVVLGEKVHSVYDEFSNLVSNQTQKETSNNNTSSIISRFLDALSSIFNPVIPAIIGAGLLKGLLILLMFYDLVEVESQLYQLLDIFSDSAFYFLPILLAVSAANRFKAQPFVAAAIVGIMIHPNLVTLMSESGTLNFLGLPITAANYGSSVIPAILTVWAMSYIERWISRIIPQILKNVLVPLLTLLLVAPLALVVIGPLGTIVGNGIAEWFFSFYQSFGILGGALFGAAFPFLVMTGMHVGFTPIMVQSLSNYGVDYLMGLNVASNSAQAGATTAVWLKTKNKEFKSVAGAAALNAIIGITEPALFGVTTKLKKPLIAVALGGGIGGAIAGGFRVEALGMGTGPIAGIPIFLGPTFIYFAISTVVAFVVSFIGTLVIGFEDIPVSDELVEGNSPMTSFNEIYGESIQSPLSGEIVPLEKVADEVFSTKMMGEGIAIKPSIGEVYAPFDGTVEVAFETKHALGLKSEKGTELLIHVGLDTVELNGKYYTMHVQPSDKIKKGDLLLEFDIPGIIEEGYSIVTPIIVTNTDDFNKISFTSKAIIDNDDRLMQTNIKEDEGELNEQTISE